jgi:hypothetical protein
MDTVTTVQTVGQAIEAAVAPVFLIVGIAGLLNMLSARLGRVIDRTRSVRAELRRSEEAGDRERRQAEMVLLRRRIELANWSIRACVSSAFVVCVLVVALFVNDFVAVDLGALVAALFVVAMLLIIVGLGTLLLEVGLASRQASRALGEG